jgi:hypothetical protein
VAREVPGKERGVGVPLFSAALGALYEPWRSRCERASVVGPALAIEAREDGENTTCVGITQEKQNVEEMNVSPGAFWGCFPA